MLIISSVIAVASIILGLLISYNYDLASGGTIVVMLSAFFAIAFVKKISTA
jgi:ABC-type Mn2+/Zn2+ transport system permease subunit